MQFWEDAGALSPPGGGGRAVGGSDSIKWETGGAGMPSGELRKLDGCDVLVVVHSRSKVQPLDAVAEG